MCPTWSRLWCLVIQKTENDCNTFGFFKPTTRTTVVCFTPFKRQIETEFSTKQMQLFDSSLVKNLTDSSILILLLVDHPRKIMCIKFVLLCSAWNDLMAWFCEYSQVHDQCVAGDGCFSHRGFFRLYDCIMMYVKHLVTVFKFLFTYMKLQIGGFALVE